MKKVPIYAAPLTQQNKWLAFFTNSAMVTMASIKILLYGEECTERMRIIKSKYLCSSFSRAEIP